MENLKNDFFVYFKTTRAESWTFEGYSNFTEKNSRRRTRSSMIYSRFHAALGDLLLCKNLTKECREKALNLLNYETGTATQGSDSRLRLNKRLNCIVFLFFTEEGLAGIKVKK